MKFLEILGIYDRGKILEILGIMIMNQPNNLVSGSVYRYWTKLLSSPELKALGELIE